MEKLLATLNEQRVVLDKIKANLVGKQTSHQSSPAVDSTLILGMQMTDSEAPDLDFEVT